MAVESIRQPGNAQSQDAAAQVLAEKFKLPPDKAKRLIELYRAALARELKRPARRHR
jgi:hypothetical protein